MNKNIKKTILIDLDGVLNEYSGKYEKDFIPKPATGVQVFLEKLSQTYNITIFTTRNTKLTKNWLKQNSLDIYITDVTNIKKPCYLYIDDRAICHNGDFDSTIHQVEKFRVHWNK